MGSFSISSWKIQKDCAPHATNWITRKWKLDSPDSAGSNRQSNPPWSSWIECRDRSRAGQECKQDFTGVSRRNLVTRVAPYLHERKTKIRPERDDATETERRDTCSPWESFGKLSNASPTFEILLALSLSFCWIFQENKRKYKRKFVRGYRRRTLHLRFRWKYT